MDSLCPGIQVWIVPGELQGLSTSALLVAAPVPGGLVTVTASRVYRPAPAVAVWSRGPPPGVVVPRPWGLAFTEGRARCPTQTEGHSSRAPLASSCIPVGKGRVDPEGSRSPRQTPSCSSSSLRAGLPAPRPAQAERPREVLDTTQSAGPLWATWGTSRGPRIRRPAVSRELSVGLQFVA